MNPGEIEEYLLDFQSRELPELVGRELQLSESKKPKSIIGPRRAGKTFFLFQKMKELLAKGVAKNQIVFLNFEDPRLIGVSFKEVFEIIKLQWRLFPESAGKELFVFIDEPQNIQSWEIAVRQLCDEGFNVFLTGSSSKLLSKEIASSLRGRSVSYFLLPFSFREFLKAKNLAVSSPMINSKTKALALSLLDEYLEFGGFPEIVLEKSNSEKLRIASEYFNLLVYRDLVERYKIKNTSVVKSLIKAAIASFAKEFSTHKTFLALKSQGLKLSKNTLYSYISMIEESAFLFFVPKFDYSVRKQQASIKKAFLCDVIFSKISESSANTGRKLENTVFLELLRKKPLGEIFYWKNIQGQEVDFVLKENNNITELIQVCESLADLQTKKRETDALLKASKELKCNSLTIISQSLKKQESVEGKTIQYKPLLDFLLEN